jgi:transposase-like protein
MSVEYKCPKCNSTVLVSVLCCYPAKIQYTCTSCDYDHTEEGNVKTITAPYPPEMQAKDMADKAIAKVTKR